MQFFELLIGIVDKMRQRFALRSRNRLSKRYVDLVFYHSGSAFQHVQKRFVLSVDIAEKVFRSLWQTAYCRKIYDLAHRAVDSGELLCE